MELPPDPPDSRPRRPRASIEVQTLPADEFDVLYGPNGRRWHGEWSAVASWLMGREFDSMTALVRSIACDGIREPVTVRGDTVTDGHHRVVAALLLGVDIPHVVLGARLRAIVAARVAGRAAARR